MEAIQAGPDESAPHVAPRPQRPFDAVRPRRSVDELMRNMSQALITYTGQADLKANIVLTTSSLVLTVVATRWSEQSLRPGMTALAVGAFLALVTATTVVAPKFRLPRQGEVRHDLAEHENPLFFGHFVTMPRDRFTAELAEIAVDDAVLYEKQAADIYDQGWYLVHKKYRHLRLAYGFLGLAFVAGAVAQAVASLI